MADTRQVNVDGVSLRPQTAAVPAEPGNIELQNVANSLKQVNDQGVATAIGGSIPDAGAASIYGATAAGPHADLTGLQALTVIMNGTSTRIDVTGADVQDVEFTGLDGETDGGYEVEFYIVGKGVSSVFVQPEELTTNLQSRGFYTNGAAVTPETGGTNLKIVGLVNGVKFSGCFYLRSKSGQGMRVFNSDVYEDDGYWTARWGGWTDTTTHITKLQIHCSGAADIGVGSWFTLRKLKKV